MPTERITFSNQLKLLRAYAIASGPAGKAVSNTDVASIVKMVPSTVGLGNGFFTDTGLLLKPNGSGFIPSPEVVAFNRAYEWNPETAATKLAPVLSRAWFSERLLPRIQMEPISEDEAISILAEDAAAGPEYRPQLRMLLEYLHGSGLILRDGTVIQSGQTRTSPEHANGQTADPDPIQRELPATRSAAVATSFMAPTEGVVQFHVSVRVDMAEFESWRPDRISAFFSGIAQVLAAKGQVEEEVSQGE